jgi:hypothetical protein
LCEVSGELTDTGHCLVVAKVMESFAVSKQAEQEFDIKDLTSGS